MKKIFTLTVLLVLSSINVAYANKTLNCAYTTDNRLVNVELHLNPKETDYFYWDGHKYEISSFERYANIYIGFSDTYKALDGSINQVGVAVNTEDGKHFLMVRDYNTKEYVVNDALSCSKMEG